MARRKGYFTAAGKKNPGGVFINNCFADAQKSSRERKKSEAAADRKRQSEARVRDRARAKESARRTKASAIAEEKARERREEAAAQERARQAEAAAQERERQARADERERVRQEEADKKEKERQEANEKLSLRLQIDFEKAKVIGYPNMDSMVNKAYSAGIKAENLKEYFIDGSEEKLREAGILNYTLDRTYKSFEIIQEEYVEFDADKEHKKATNTTRYKDFLKGLPLDGTCDEAFIDAKDFLNTFHKEWSTSRIEEILFERAETKRLEDLVEFFKAEAISLRIFSDDLSDMVVRAEEGDMTVDQVKSSEFLAESIKNKKDFRSQLKEKLAEFM